ncbi:MAG: Ni/Fe hydrogenase subunit alpha [Nanoarchaeota archaeon]|nr:Ni/Fe hydrogenase subunit alpha [Nanoarchaeota archaeon]
MTKEEKTNTKKITLNHITKVEGHAEVDISIKDGKVEHCHVHSVEGARYFEGIIKGRKYDEITMITSRICGICSCGHTIASIKAIENALNIKPTKQTELIRELVTIGERIRSHASHIYFFSLPDYLGYESAIAMAKEYNKEIKDCLEIVRVGNELVKLTGGRDMHPFVPVVGGFTKIHPQEEFERIKKELKASIPLIKNCIKLFASLKVPKYTKDDTVFMSLSNHKTFPLHTGNLVSNTGLEFKEEDYQNFIKEYFHNNSTAKFASIEGKEFMTGALARINNDFDKLSKTTKEMIKKYKMEFPTNNIFMNNQAQALEILHWTERAIEIIENNKFKEEEPIKPQLNKPNSKGVGAIEVPRGILFHDYTFNEEGYLTEATIITPTVQNLADMELNVKTYLNEVLEKDPYKSKEKLQIEIEKMVRAFDPCFSCSTHFLKVNWNEKE